MLYGENEPSEIQTVEDYSYFVPKLPSILIGKKIKNGQKYLAQSNTQNGYENQLRYFKASLLLMAHIYSSISNKYGIRLLRKPSASSQSSQQIKIEKKISFIDSNIGTDYKDNQNLRSEILKSKSVPSKGLLSGIMDQLQQPVLIGGNNM